MGAATSAALAAGRVNTEQAATVVRALHELPDDVTEPGRLAAEHTMLDQAAEHDPVVLTRLRHRILDYVAPDVTEKRLRDQLEREQREAARKRSATRHTDGHGNVYYKLRSPVADDAHLAPILDALARPTPATDGVRDQRAADQQRADAFVETFRRVSLDGDLPVNGGDRPRAVITMRLHDLVDGVGAASLTDTGEQLSPTAARQLACDAQLIPAVLNSHGQVLDLGRTRRTFEGPARLAVTLRDRGCIHPGCDRPVR